MLAWLRIWVLTNLAVGLVVCLESLGLEGKRVPGSDVVSSYAMFVFCSSQVSHHGAHSVFAEAVLDASS